MFKEEVADGNPVSQGTSFRHSDKSLPWDKLRVVPDSEAALGNEGREGETTPGQKMRTNQ
jgi:hypothetical protein